MEKPSRSEKAQEAMDKYMNETPMYLAELVKALNQNFDDLPAWQQTIVADAKADIQIRLKEHFEVAAATRQKFESVPPNLWQDPSNGMFNLTEQPRKMLGYLPKRELQHLNEIAMQPMQQSMAEMRRELSDTMDKMRASEQDRAEIADTLALEHCRFEELAHHHKELDKWIPLRDLKVPIITELEQREEFLEEIEEFESKASGDKDRYRKANALALADENKFRSYAAKKLKELDSKAIKLCRQYQADTNRPFEIDGVLYLEMIKEQKYGRPSNTNLSLAKLSPTAISSAEKHRFQGGVASNLRPGEPEGMMQRVSLHEAGEDPKIIRRKSLQTSDE